MSDTPETTAEAKPKKKGKLPLIIILVVLLAAGGGGYYFFVMRAASAKAAAKAKKAAKAADEEASADEEAEADKGNKSDGANVKQVVELQPFIVNLADKENTRYLRMTVSLGMGGEGEEESKPDTLMTTRARDAMIAVLTSKSSNDIISAEGKMKLREELLKAARKVVKEPRIEAIYITDFIIQM